MEKIKIIQANVNNSKPSLDLLVHQPRELDAGILLISESNIVPGSNGWFTSKDGKAAIFFATLIGLNLDVG